jgi:hypothetical protein
MQHETPCNHARNKVLQHVKLVITCNYMNVTWNYILLIRWHAFRAVIFWNVHVIYIKQKYCSCKKHLAVMKCMIQYEMLIPWPVRVTIIHYMTCNEQHVMSVIVPKMSEIFGNP